MLSFWAISLSSGTSLSFSCNMSYMAGMGKMSFWKRRGKTQQKAFSEYATGWECMREWKSWTSKKIWNKAGRRVGQAQRELIFVVQGIIEIGLRLAHYLQNASKQTTANDRNIKENNSGDDKAIRAMARANVQLCRCKDKGVLKFKLSCAAFLRFWRSFFRRMSQMKIYFSLMTSKSTS